MTEEERVSLIEREIRDIEWDYAMQNWRETSARAFKPLPRRKSDAPLSAKIIVGIIMLIGCIIAIPYFLISFIVRQVWTLYIDRVTDHHKKSKNINGKSRRENPDPDRSGSAGSE